MTAEEWASLIVTDDTPTPQLQNGYLSRLETKESYFPRFPWHSGQGACPPVSVLYAELSSDATTPGADCRIAAAVRMKDSERIGRSRFARHGHEHAAPARERLENPAVVLLEPDTTRRRSNPVTGQVAVGALQRLHDETPGAHRTHVSNLECAGRGAEHPLDQRSDVR